MQPEIDAANHILDFLERMVESRFVGMVVMGFVIIGLIIWIRHQAKAIRQKDTDLAAINKEHSTTLLGMVRETTAAMTESSAVIDKIADAMQGARK